MKRVLTRTRILSAFVSLGVTARAHTSNADTCRSRPYLKVTTVGVVLVDRVPTEYRALRKRSDISQEGDFRQKASSIVANNRSSR